MTIKQLIVGFSGITLVLFSSFEFKKYDSSNPDIKAKEKPKISFTFDDGVTENKAQYKFEVWNKMLLQNLKKHKIKAIFFSMGFNKLDIKGKYLLKSWNDEGHLIANHSFTHPNFNGSKQTLKSFEIELLKNDSIIKKYSNFYPFFRFPYLKEGENKIKIEGFRKILRSHNYKNGHVSIDASDWYIEGRLVDKLKSNPNADLSGYKTYYINHLTNRANYYDSLAFKLTNRRINHVILLHHNLINALFLDDLIKKFKSNGWQINNAELAYKDSFYKNTPTNVPTGESLVWSMAKQSVKHNKTLRYPAEDGNYEKPLMDKLGL
jgi:peptidoglycan-N-acetylglucosamine deacetylase